jgi:hypothetical protein
MFSTQLTRSMNKKTVPTLATITAVHRENHSARTTCVPIGPIRGVISDPTQDDVPYTTDTLNE